MSTLGAYIGAGVTEGASQVYKNEQERPFREARLAEAKARQQKSELALQDYEQNAPVRDMQREAELANLKKQARIANSQNLNAATYSAFDRFEADGDARHLNTLLKQARNNPIGQSLYSHIARFDLVTRSKSTDALLKKAGIKDLEGFYSNPDNMKDFVITTNPQGENTLWDMEQVYAATGYTNYMTDKQLTELERRARIKQLGMSGQKYSKIGQRERVIESLMEEDGLTYNEAFKRTMEMENAGRGTADERIINAIAEREGIDILEAAEKFYSAKRQGTGTTNESRYIEEYMSSNPDATYEEAAESYANRTKTSTQKEQGDIQSARDSLEEMGLFDKPMSEFSQPERLKMQANVARIEDMRGIKLSTEEKRIARDMRNLTMLGGQAGSELTPEETGLIDNMLNNFKKYLVDEVGGKKATSSYETFRNIFRNALYGSALTKNETAYFDKAAGSLKQQFKPAMAQLRTQLQTIKSNLESIVSHNDPYVTQFYLGEDVERIDEAIRQIDERLDVINKYTVRVSKGEQPTVTSSEPTDIEPTEDKVDKERKPLDEIFGGTN